jgi:hypothetical protein
MLLFTATAGHEHFVETLRLTGRPTFVTRRSIMVSVDVIGTRSSALRGVRVILLASILFGAMAVCVRVAGQEMGALQVAFIRFVGSLAVLLAATAGAWATDPSLAAVFAEIEQRRRDAMLRETTELG